MLSEPQKDGTEIVEKGGTCMETIIQTRRATRLFTAAVIHYSNQSGARPFPHRMVWDAVSVVSSISVSHLFNETFLFLLCYDSPILFQ